MFIEFIQELSISGGFHQERGGHAPARTKIQMRSTDGKRKAALFLDPISSFSFG
jgi:hypothetical protein